MLNRLPRQVPPLSMMLDDIGRPSPRELARAFDVTERTVRRWIADDSAPLTVLLALFWLTSWGISAVDAEAHNSAVMSASMVRVLRGQVSDLKARLDRLGKIADFGAANDPAPGVMLAPVATPVRAVQHKSRSATTSPTTHNGQALAYGEREWLASGE